MILGASKWSDLMQSKEWWLPFRDGWSHVLGAHGFDATIESQENGQDGRVHDRLYESIIDLDENRPLSAEILESMNFKQTGVMGSQGIYTLYQPRRHHHNAIKTAGLLFVAKPGTDDRDPIVQNSTRMMLDEMLRTFYTYARKPNGGEDGRRGRMRRPKQEMRRYLQPLAWLYVNLAELHPFRDANSRARAVVLQHSMLRYGGIPLLLPDLGWWVYYATSFKTVQDIFLCGWCASKYYKEHGTSPYVDMSKIPKDRRRTPVKGWFEGVLTLRDDLNVKDEAFRICRSLYDAERDTCREQNDASLRV
jgi:hypothetical protein